MYKYRQPRLPEPRISRPGAAPKDEPKRYTVQGKKASEEEAMIAEALREQGLSFRFRVLIPTPWSIPGQLNEIDFIVEGRYLIEFDGEFAHKTASQRAHDLLRDQLLNAYLRPQGYLPIRRISHLEVYDLASARRFVLEELA